MTYRLNQHTKQTVLNSVEIVSEAAAREGFFHIQLQIPKELFSLLTDNDEEQYVFVAKYGTVLISKKAV